MFAIKVILTTVLLLLGVTAAWFAVDNQLAFNLVSFIIGLSSRAFSDWFVDWVKENI